MKITLWGTRGSLACSGPETAGYGGNTSCVEVHGEKDTVIILDAGTGIRRLGVGLNPKIKRVDILLTHLHLDHIQGLGFFAPLYDPTMEVHMYGPARNEHHLYSLLTKYLSPPLFPVLLRDLPCQLYLHTLPQDEFSIGEFKVCAQTVFHPGFTVGYRIRNQSSSMAYLPDHEPALGAIKFPLSEEWTSGYSVAENVDLLIHDAQYTQEEYETRIGWGHSTIEQALLFGELAKVKKFVTFHHDPSHTDEMLEMILAKGIATIKPSYAIESGKEGAIYTLS